MRAMLFMMAAVMFGVAFFAVTAQVTSDARSPDFDFIETTALVSMAWYAAIGAVIGMLASVWLAIACGHWRTPRLAWAMAVVLSGVMLIGWLTAPGVRGLSLDRLFDSPGNELRRWRPPPFWLNSVTFVTSFTLITLGLRAMLLNAARRPRFRRRMLRRLVLQQSPWRRVRG
ncbi:MAG: hypothetical protein CMJ31_06180 [Phycisphaerae bacterium]|nr:hypothetical protein [Phycisphaerae bacterium]